MDGFRDGRYRTFLHGSAGAKRTRLLSAISSQV